MCAARKRANQQNAAAATIQSNYRGKARRRPEGDRVVVLEDKDQDGVAETSTVFVQDGPLR